jgi:hypothetical protein
MRFISKRAFAIFSILAVLVAGALQTSGLIGFLGVKPNFILATLIIVALFTESFSLYVLLAFLGGLSVAGGAGFTREAWALTAVAALIFWLKNRRVTQTLLGSAILMIAGTGVLYALIDFRFLYEHSVTVLIEAAYNVIIGVLLFELCVWYQKKTK